MVLLTELMVPSHLNALFSDQLIIMLNNKKCIVLQ